MSRLMQLSCVVLWISFQKEKIFTTVISYIIIVCNIIFMLLPNIGVALLNAGIQSSAACTTCQREWWRDISPPLLCASISLWQLYMLTRKMGWAWTEEASMGSPGVVPPAHGSVQLPWLGQSPGSHYLISHAFFSFSFVDIYIYIYILDQDFN